MNLRDQIGSIVATLQVENEQGAIVAPTFVYGRKSEVNISVDNIPGPYVILIEPDQFGFYLPPGSGSLRDTHNVFIQFVDGIVMGENADYRHPVVVAMKRLAAQFIYALAKSEVFQDFGPNIPGMLVVDTYDRNVAGIELNIGQLTDIYPIPC